MYKSHTTIRVRYGETDQMGYVYYGVYAMYYEVGRVESLRALGLSYKQIEEMGIIMPVLEHKCKYLAPGKYDELLTIVTVIPQKPTVKIYFQYEIYNESQKLINQGETILAFIDKKTTKPCRPPEKISRVLEAYF